ncbi:MAG: phosphoglycolate phosphatase [Candidatus Muproteobacteria bacterium RBG_16_64_11]|uniref:phosphoglycolate phosphatase n=1 Tax=Candidatus Muproteobacteria bacterium RBG_16_64_11 TaxID=1817758 RepID=A0A1F6TB43_9PROT|nr:MAG: phosphoglycolate phosphatase [Candidatus Muproteobacteria bacterium RBG_16_64_11]
MTSKIRTVLFDLDGTLADTAPDLAGALNALLVENGRQPLPYEAIRPQVSHGATALITLGFGLTAGAPGFEALRQRLLAIYQAGLCRETKLFPGMAAVLAGLRARGCNWGVVTNKPAFLTEPLMAALGLDAGAACIVSGDSTANRKPHPEPMLHACALAGSHPDQCLYVGDAERDVTAGKMAGMPTLVALFGYIGDNERPQDWGADGLVQTPAGILEWLNTHE